MDVIDTGYEKIPMSYFSIDERLFNMHKIGDLGKTRFFQNGSASQSRIIIIEDLYLPIELYLPTIHALSEQYNIMTYDLLSQGQTDVIISPTMDQYVQQLFELMEHLLLKKYRFSVIAHGFGANILVSTLQQHPDYISNLQKVYMFGPQIHPKRFPIEQRQKKDACSLFKCCQHPIYVIQDEYRQILAQLNKGQQTGKEYFIKEFYKGKELEKWQQFYVYMSSFFEKSTLGSYDKKLSELMTDSLYIYYYPNNQFTDNELDQKFVDYIRDGLSLEKQVATYLDGNKCSYLLFATNPLMVKQLIEEQNKENE